MDLPQTITTRVDTKINAMFSSNPSVHSFLKNHERRPELEKNLLKEIRNLEYSKAIKLDATRIHFIIDGFAQTFCHKALEAAKDAAMSETQKQTQLKQRSDFFEEQKIFEDAVKTDGRDYTESL